MKIASIKAVLFDCDGVIADTMGDHATAWVKAFRDHGIEVRGEWVFEYEGAPFRDVARDFFKRRGLCPDERSVEAVALDKERYFDKLHRPSLYRGIFPIFDMLQERGIPVALVTGASRLAIARTLPENVSGRFNAIVTGDDVARGKPHPDPYLRAAQLLGLGPEDCLVIENSVFGLHSVKAAGMRCIALCTTLDARYLVAANLVCSDHYELKREIEVLFSNPPPTSQDS